MIPFTQPYIVQRYSDGAYSAGEWTDDGPDPLTITMHIQPDNAAGGIRLSDTDGARWAVGKVQIYSESELYCADTSPDGKADRLSWRGATYELTSVGQYDEYTPIPHWSCVAELIDGNVIT